MKFTFANNIEAMNERLHVSIKVEPRSTSCLISTLYILPLFYLRDQNLHALTCGAKNASVEIHPNVTYVSGMCLHTGSFVLDYHALYLQHFMSIE